MIPLALRDRIARAFRPRQIDNPNVANLAWREADADVRRWIADSEAPARMVA